jgi:hypothetical protein
MATTSTRQIITTFTGTVNGTETYSAISNPSSPGQIQVITITQAVNNPLTIPISGVTVTGLTIIPPSTNTQTIVLKGANSDAGVNLHPSDPSSFGIAVGATLILTIGVTLTGVILIWT